jgi:protein gp37
MTTAIEWTDETWNPTTGCDKVSPGCGLPRPGSDDEKTGNTGGCYALKMAGRLKAMGQPRYQRDGDPSTSGPGFGLTLHADALDLPLKWRKPRRVFVNSMSDLFHKDVPDAFIADVFAVMGLARHHTFQVLTKRPQRMAALLGDVSAWLESLDRATLRMAARSDEAVSIFADFVSASEYPPHWWWLGTSIESDRYAFRADHLRATPAAVRFLSLEPLLGPLPSLDLTGIDWVITGGESGPGARPSHPDWYREIRDRCVDAGAAYFHKQWGHWAPERDHPGSYQGSVKGGNVGYNGEWGSPTAKIWGTVHPPEFMVGLGKKKAGRMLDGRTWDEMPERVVTP